MIQAQMSPLTLSRMRLRSRLSMACRLFGLLTIGISLIVNPLQAKAQSSGGTSFFDRLAPNDQIFFASDGYGNGSPFINAWKSDHVTFPGNHMELTLDNQSNFGYQYTSGEYRTHGFYGYGIYAVRMKPSNQHGVISSFFTFAGPYDVPSGATICTPQQQPGSQQGVHHNEIDIEFLNKDNGPVDAHGQPIPQMQVNFYTNDDAYSQRHEHLVPLYFNPANAYHMYGFIWTHAGIAWFVDGHIVYWVANTAAHPTPDDGSTTGLDCSHTTQRIMMNLWGNDGSSPGIIDFGGTFNYAQSAAQGKAPMHADYSWVAYQASPCNFDKVLSGLHP
jgi:beta-glucanase (GH16 family)